MTVLAAVLAVALVVQTVRLRAALGEGAAARDVAVSSLLFAVAASAEAQRRRVELVALAGRAAEIERDVSALTLQQFERHGEISAGGYRLIGEAHRLTCAVREVADGLDGG